MFKLVVYFIAGAVCSNNWVGQQIGMKTGQFIQLDLVLTVVFWDCERKLQEMVWTLAALRKGGKPRNL